MSETQLIPIIDLFAGPGGLGEGFSSLSHSKTKFRICLSIEKEKNAHQTLRLRAFYRQFKHSDTPPDYYALLKNEITQEQLFNRFPYQAEKASQEAQCAELGVTDQKWIDGKIQKALKGNKVWVLIGGPPCQAYSLVGRSRMKKCPEIFSQDKRHFLYEEYLRIIAVHRPPVFVMENVKGMLSSQNMRMPGQKIIDKIMDDLRDPRRAIHNCDGQTYRIFSLVKTAERNGMLFEDDHYVPSDYVVTSENYGIPQARHRVIMLGLRDDLNGTKPRILKHQKKISSSKVLAGLPRVRSGLSRNDSPAAWLSCIEELLHAPWLSDIDKEIKSKLVSTIENLSVPRLDRGDEYLECNCSIQYEEKWFIDMKLNGVCNHITRAHIPEDLHRYIFAACFAKVSKRSPVLGDFPKALLPNHVNVKEALKSRLFTDRFRVQLFNRPATTVTSHISKDGHYYIHPDPSQCRSLTVREAARLQTFPDNYFFCGPRTAQYHQVGNAVPPLLARQIAQIVLDVLKQADMV